MLYLQLMHILRMLGAISPVILLNMSGTWRSQSRRTHGNAIMQKQFTAPANGWTNSIFPDIDIDKGGDFDGLI